MQDPKIHEIPCLYGKLYVGQSRNKGTRKRYNYSRTRKLVVAEHAERKQLNINLSQSKNTERRNKLRKTND